MTYTTKITMMALLLTAALAPLSAADAFGYTSTSNTPYSYVDVSSTGVSILAGDDDSSATLNLPFQFRFYGISYNSLCVSTNGLISFGSCVPNDFTNLDLTAQSPGGNQPLIAPLWMDLTFGQPGAGSIVYQTLGSGPGRQFVVQWNNSTALNSPGTLGFQVILFETTNVIAFQYQNVETGSAAVSKGASATVGIRGASGNTNGNRSQWSFKAPVLSNNLAIKFTPPAAVAPVDVSSQVTVTTTAFVYNRITQQYSGSLTITNTGGTPIPAPVTMVLTNLTPGVTALNAAGTAPGLGPFYNAPGTSAMVPGQSTTVSLLFSNPSNARISFVLKTYSGSF
jgi:hypothetical protein